MRERSRDLIAKQEDYKKGDGSSYEGGEGVALLEGGGPEEVRSMRGMPCDQKKSRFFYKKGSRMRNSGGVKRKKGGQNS